MSSRSPSFAPVRSASRLLGRVGALLRSVPKRTWIGILITVALWWVFMYFTRFPDVQEKSEIMTVLSVGAPNTFSELVSREDWPYWLSWIPTGINMNENNAIGMAFAFLIGGAVTSLVLPQRWVNAMLEARGEKGASLGGLLGAPLMMCSACSVPVALGWKERGANAETTLGVIMGSALLNVMGLMAIFVLFPAPLAWGRLAASLLLVVLVTPLMVRLARWWKPLDLSPTCRTGPDDADSAPAGKGRSSSPRDESWGEATVAALKEWWQASVEIAYRLFLPMTAAIFLAAVVRLFVPEVVVETYLGGGFLAIAGTALVGTLIAVPTLFEIPLTLSFIFLGMGAGPAAALIVTAPSVSLVSHAMLYRDVGHRAPALLLLATFLVGLGVGMGVEMAGIFLG